jgi:hypothetical protein
MVTTWGNFGEHLLDHRGAAGGEQQARQIARRNHIFVTH